MTARGIQANHVTGAPEIPGNRYSYCMQQTAEVSAGNRASLGVPPPSRPGRLPLTKRNANTPYVRLRLPSDSSRSGGPNVNRPCNSTSTASGARSNEAQGTNEICQKLLDEVRRGREEQRGIRDVRKVAQLVAKLEEYKKLNDQLKQQEDASFTVESSIYKVTLTTLYSMSYFIVVHGHIG